METIKSGHKENVPWKISDVIFTYALIFSLSLVAVGIILMLGIDSTTSLFPALLQLILSFITLSVIYIIITKKYHLSFFDSLGILPRKMPKFFFTGVFVSFLSGE